MTLSADPVTHAARANIFQHEAVWRLALDALEREGGEPANAPWWARLSRMYLMLLVPWGLDRIERGGSARFAYRDIRLVRLTYEPLQLDDARHRCELRLKTGEKALIYSSHFQSAADSENRASTYVPLVRELVARVAAANPACRFWSGKSRWVYWMQSILILALLLALVFVLGYFSGFKMSDLLLAKLVVVIGFIPIAILYAVKNWPRQFKPPAIPAEAMPAD
jgi:hypothetical protein